MGRFTCWGAYFAATLYEKIITSYTAHWKIILGPLLVLFVLFVRRGLYGLLGGGETADEQCG